MRFITLVTWLWALSGAAPATAQAPTPDQSKTTAAWIQSLQKDNGGFASDAKSESKANLQATVQALRALKAFGADIQTKSAQKFVSQCYDDKLGGYAPAPGGKVDCRSTAYGLMAVAELKMSPEQYVVQPVIYLCSHVKKYEEYTLAAGAYDAVQSKCELATDWVVAIHRRENPDGTFGKGNTQVRDTALAITTLLRLGDPVERRNTVVKFLKSGQLSDGGWGTDGKTSNLETTYQVTRALKFLKDHGDTKACQKFVAGCRRDDGSYAARADEPGSLSATYNAAMIMRWLDSASSSRR